MSPIIRTLKVDRLLGTNFKKNIVTFSGAALLDHDVFARVWGPTIAALAFNFDKTRQPAVLARAVSGFTQVFFV